jgi:hypothetical protein
MTSLVNRLFELSRHCPKEYEAILIEASVALQKGRMITEEELVKCGYEVLPQGGWVRLSPEIIPRDWEDICQDFGVDPDCHEIILAVCGVKEIKEGINEEV